MVNRSSINIIEIYASPASSDNWGRNWIVNNVVRTNEQARIEPGNAAGCVYDVRVVYANKQTEDRRSQNVCQLNQIVFAGSGGGANGGTASGGASGGAARGGAAPGGAAPGNINTTFEVVNGSLEVIFFLQPARARGVVICWTATFFDPARGFEWPPGPQAAACTTFVWFFVTNDPRNAAGRISAGSRSSFSKEQRARPREGPHRPPRRVATPAVLRVAVRQRARRPGRAPSAPASS